MLKKITFCFLVALLICTFAISAFAAQYQFEVADSSLEFNDLQIDVDYWSDSFNCIYSFSAPLHDNANNADIVSVKIIYDASITSLSAELYTSSGVFNYSDTPVLQAFGGVVTVETSDDVGYDLAVDMFTKVFGDEAYAGSVPVYTGIFAVFTQIVTWIAAALLSVVALFWANGSLTFFGILTLIALGIALFFLLCGIISRFLRFRS